MQPVHTFAEQMGVVPEQVVLSVHWTHAPLAEQAGAAGFLAAQSLAAVQAAHTFAEQMGVAPEQPTLVRHWTHLFVVMSHTGMVPEQVLLSVHWTHVPVAEHAEAAGLLAAHWLAAVQAAHTLPEQIGVAPEQPALVRHWTHLFVVVSHTGVVPEQVVLSVHWTHAPLAEQAGAAGFLAAHWLAAVQAVHTLPEQIGVAPEHLVLSVHWTHLFVVVSHTGVVPEQVVLSAHWTQVPLAEQAGAAGFLARHWLAAVQAVHALPEQIGVAPEQLVLSVHWTHLFVVVSHTGVVPEQVLLSVHWTQVPPAEQAGAVGFLARHWLAAVQAVHALPEQIGVAPEQPALVRHFTHCPPTPAVSAGAHSNPAQAVAPALSQPTQAPATQNARAGSLQSPTAPHSTQALATHTALPGFLQSGEVAHSTQTPPLHAGRASEQSPFTLHPGCTISAVASALASPVAPSILAPAAVSAETPLASAVVSEETPLASAVVSEETPLSLASAPSMVAGPLTSREPPSPQLGPAQTQN